MSLKEILKNISEEWVVAINEQFTEHPIANLVRKNLVEEVKKILGGEIDNYLIQSSPGSGNWASVPWLSILNPLITKSTQSGVYPVYLFRADGTGVYLSLCFGTTELSNRYGVREAKLKVSEFREKACTKDPRLLQWNNLIDLRSNTSLGRSYEWATAGSKFYPTNLIPDEDQLQKDLLELLSIYSAIKSDFISSPKIESNANFFSPIPKPFLLLAGISGTGKTRFVRNQSEHNCLVTPVRPDWHEPSDILGYVSRLNKAEKNTYVVTDVLCFIVRAWKAAFDNGVVFENTSAVGNAELLDAIAPFWLCLDEMNLAPVEQYFADYLSVLESRKWHWEDDSFNYCSLPLLSSGVISAVDKQSLRTDLQLDQSNYDDLWNYFCQNGIPLPFNLIVAGTVNMDETTHGFSRKVIDRAITLDFGEFYPNGFDTFFNPIVKPKHFTYPRLSNINNKDQLKDVAADTDGIKTIAFLTAINVVLSDTPFELAYRALNELLLSVVCSNPQDDAELYAVWDDFLMTKILPRIEGDADKLQKVANGKPLALLPELLNVIKNQLGDLGATRKDYFLEQTAGDDKSHFIPYRSPKKIEWMQARLNSATFTSFWP